MKIISPVDNRDEVPVLIDAGVEEFYGGYVPAQWSRRFSLLASINQRTFESAQIESFDDLRAIIDQAHEAGCSFSLTVNAPFYTDQQMPALLEYIDSLVDAGIDGLILADIGLLRLVRRQYPDLELHGSTLAHLSNSEAIAIYADNGIDRVILPRHLPVSEMAQIVASVPGVVFDAFLLVGKCPNTEGLCTFHHSSPDRIWPCEIPYAIEPESGPATAQLDTAMLRQDSWSKTNRRHGCGLCAIPHLKRAGVTGLKLVGRGAPTAQKVKNVLLARDCVELAEQLPDFSDYRRRAVAAHAGRFGAPCSPNVCYYPEYYSIE